MSRFVDKLDIPVENVFAYCLSALGLGGARLKRYAAVFHCRSDPIRFAHPSIREMVLLDRPLLWVPFVEFHYIAIC